MRKIMMWSAWFWLVFAAQGALAAEIEIKQFQAGDVISAADVNNNFKALAEAVQQLQQQVAELQKQNKALLEENRALKKSLAKVQTKTTEPDKETNAAVSVSASKNQKYRLRSEPETVSSDAEAKRVFGLDDQWRPLKYIENDFKVQGDAVIDHATGLMWQKADSKLSMNYKQAQEYIKQLNRNRFAGYADWRLPTVDELLSLVEFENQSNGRRINSVFINTLTWYCSADIHDNNVWNVNYNYGNVNWTENNFVRAVRSLQP